MATVISQQSEYPDDKRAGACYEVLVVDDSKDDAELFVRLLHKAQTDLGIEISATAVSSSTQAIRQLENQKFDAIFLDIGMPPPDGIELTRRIRSMETNRSSSIVILTGAEDRGMMTRAFQAGANFFLFKPINRTRLLQVIQISRVPMDRERRRLQRVKVRRKVSIESQQGRLDGETVDICLNGILVHAKQTLPLGAFVTISLSLAPGSAAMRTAASVVRIDDNQCMGLQFEKTSEMESERLGQFLIPLILSSGQ